LTRDLQDWTWKEKYPGWEELRGYFEHVDKVLDIRKDVAFNTRVTEARFEKSSNKWVVKTEDGRTARVRFLLLATGFAAKACCQSLC
jgi:cation diffusion facilitator CzcD-associated flavoprotein CzcO